MDKVALEKDKAHAKHWIKIEYTWIGSAKYSMLWGSSKLLITQMEIEQPIED